MVKLCLIQAINEDRDIQKRYPPLGLAYLASYLMKYGYGNITINRKIKDILYNKPDVVGISSVTQNFDIAIKIAQRIKEELEVPVLVGGNHISALPNYLPECFDVGIIGEGEDTLLEIMNLIDDGKSEVKYLRDIRGIVFRDGKKLCITPKRPLINPLDLIPPPKRDLFVNEWGYEFKDNMYMMTSRGCPYKCIFCSSSQMWEKTRFFSAEYVVKEIKEIVDKFKVSTINIYDDLFISNKKRLKKIVELINKYGIKEETQFTCNIRAEIFNEEIAKLLKDMNVSVVSFGAESGSDKVLSWLGKDSVQSNQKVINICEKIGIGVACSFIFGSIIETKIDALKTYEFIRKNKNKLLIADIYPLVPFPGTELWKQVTDKKIIPEDIKWHELDIDYDNFDIDKYLLINEYLNKDEFYELFIHFQKLHDDIVILNQLKNLQSQLNNIQEQIFRQNLSIHNLEDQMRDTNNWIKTVQNSLLYRSISTLKKLKI